MLFSMTIRLFFFFFNDTATTEIYTLSLHDALPISTHHDAPARRCRVPAGCRRLVQVAAGASRSVSWSARARVSAAWTRDLGLRPQRVGGVGEHLGRVDAGVAGDRASMSCAVAMTSSARPSLRPAAGGAAAGGVMSVASWGDMTLSP